jgi:hypothetical protein
VENRYWQNKGAIQKCGSRKDRLPPLNGSYAVGHYASLTMTAPDDNSNPTPDTMEVNKSVGWPLTL